jgi:hypothetical protein
VAFGFVQRLILLPAESLLALVVCCDVLRCFFDQLERQLVAGFVIVVPVDEAVLAQNNASRIRMLLMNVLQNQPSSKPGRSHGVQMTSSP